MSRLSATSALVPPVPRSLVIVVVWIYQEYLQVSHGKAGRGEVAFRNKTAQVVRFRGQSRTHRPQVAF